MVGRPRAEAGCLPDDAKLSEIREPCAQGPKHGLPALRRQTLIIPGELAGRPQDALPRCVLIQRKAEPESRHGLLVRPLAGCFVQDVAGVLDEVARDEGLVADLRQELALLYENKRARRYLEVSLSREDDVPALVAVAEDVVLGLLVDE